MRLTPALHLGPLALVIVAACDKTDASGTTGSAPPPPTVIATASAAATASASAPTPDALPSADPPTVHSSAAPTPTASATASAKPATSAKPDAGAKPPKVAATAAPDGGAADAGAVAATDAGAPNPALAVAKQVDAIFASAKTFSARFKQQYHIKVYDKTETSTGTVFIERPGKISFRYDPPNDNRIVSDGTTIKIYQAAEKQMTEMAMAQTAFPGALAFMLGNGISQSFDFAINTKAQWSGGVVLDGKPLTPTTNCKLAMFYIDEPLLQRADPNTIRRVLIIDPQDNRNRFDFEKITQPASINPAEFTFTPPPGTDIKRQ